jgi:hypothetical protein
LKYTDVSEMRPASTIRAINVTALIMETVRISETSVYLNETTLYAMSQTALIFILAAERTRNLTVKQTLFSDKGKIWGS